MRTALLLLALLAQDTPKHYDPAVHEATRTFTYADFLVVPVRVHLLQSKEADALHCRLKDQDVRRVFGKANRIWNKAGLALSLESIVCEDALCPEGFDASRLEDFKTTRPLAGIARDMVHVYYVHTLPTNGVFMGRDAIFVKDSAALREVKGGVDEPLPRVTSHEIGHALGLPHRQNTINLMASGTTGWSVSDPEIETVRSWASTQEWILSPAAAFDKGHYEILAALPGESPLKEKAVEKLRVAASIPK
ncbi:MAG TPA: matrixin family metalloprotease [Planctomycetota bacterium]|jgi:hypothetical protein|nr:matrixin family metalloprotease [Planctomycetota bacterium]